MTDYITFPRSVNFPFLPAGGGQRKVGDSAIKDSGATLLPRNVAPEL